MNPQSNNPPTEAPVADGPAAQPPVEALAEGAGGVVGEQLPAQDAVVHHPVAVGQEEFALAGLRQQPRIVHDGRIAALPACARN